MRPIDWAGGSDRLDQQGHYGKPDVSELGGETPVAVLDDVVIRWDLLLERLPAVEP